MDSKVVEDLVVAALAVNSYPATWVWELVPALREQGIFEPEQVAAKDNGASVIGLAPRQDRDRSYRTVFPADVRIGSLS